MKIKHQDFTQDQLKAVRENWQNLTNDGLLKHLQENFGYTGKITTLRTAMYKIGLRKCLILRWTPAETKYLIDNYQRKGNIEIAKKLTKRNRIFTKKNVEKKMKLLGLKRSDEQRSKIIRKHVKKGTYSEANFKRWEAKKIPENSTVVQVRAGRPTVMIKIDGLLTPYARYRYEALHGKIPSGHRVHFIDADPLNVADENLELRKGCGYGFKDRQKYRRNVQRYLTAQKLNEPVSEITAPVVVSKQPIDKGLVAVRVNDKTIIRVKPGINIEELKRKYNVLRV